MKRYEAEVTALHHKKTNAFMEFICKIKNSLNRGSKNSLRSRLLIFSSVLFTFFVGLSGLGLDQAFQHAQVQHIEERLKLQLYSLLAASSLADDRLLVPEQLEQQPELHNPASGMYAIVLDGYGEELWRSPSALWHALPNIYDPQEPGSVSFKTIASVSDEEPFLYVSKLKVIWEGVNDTEHPFTFVMMESPLASAKEVNAFRATLWVWLSLLIIVLLILVLYIIGWVLRPFRQLARDIEKIESGDKEYLQGQYPIEVTQLTTRLNLLIKQERGQRERYRNTMADLAHSLKTPLTVLQGAHLTANQLKDYQETVTDQVVRMNQIISYQLSRAVTSKGCVLGKPVEIQGPIEKILGAMKKVYRDKTVNHEIAIPKNTIFIGDESDFMEMLGNFIDNAHKWCKQQVYIQASIIGTQDTIGKTSTLEICIGDDGPGVAPEKRQHVLQRGARADTSVKGHGIGLDICVDIISSYNGSLEIQASKYGGALFIVKLPLG